VAPQKLIVSLVGLEPGREQIAKAGERAKDGVYKNVDRHANKHHAGNSGAEAMNKDQRGKGGRRSVAETRNKPDNRIEAHSVLGAGNRDEIIKDIGEEAGEFVAIIRGGRKQFHLNFLNLLLHEAIDRMVVPAFKRLCSFSINELPAKRFLKNPLMPHCFQFPEKRKDPNAGLMRGEDPQCHGAMDMSGEIARPGIWTSADFSAV
jgi:hypothetical protein